ncbi:MAG: hypothetical protein OXC68_15310 [Aestuariivita sp.]|nr:hypothetical protein [Aestuariivita sp.]
MPCQWGGVAVAQNCGERPAIEIGFKKRSITVNESKTASLEVTAVTKGDHSEANPVTVTYRADLDAWYQRGQFNESRLFTGTASTNDFTATSGTISFSQSVTSQIINVPVINDGENDDNEKFYVNLAIPTQDPASVTNTHRAKAETCANPIVTFKTYGYFAAVNIRDSSWSNHWLYGNN